MLTDPGKPLTLRRGSFVKKELFFTGFYAKKGQNCIFIILYYCITEIYSGFKNNVQENPDFDKRRIQEDKKCNLQGYSAGLIQNLDMKKPQKALSIALCKQNRPRFSERSGETNYTGLKDKRRVDKERVRDRNPPKKNSGCMSAFKVCRKLFCGCRVASNSWQ